jgi:hypothetical protein
VVAPGRLAAVRSAVAVGVVAVGVVEALSAVHAVTAGPIIGLWLTALAASAVLALVRRRRDRAAGRGIGIRDATVARWRAASPIERLLGVALAVVVIAGLPVRLWVMGRCCCGTSGTSASHGIPGPFPCIGGVPPRYAPPVRIGSASSWSVTSGSTRGG